MGVLLWARIPQKWSSPHSQQKSPKCNIQHKLKNDRMISVHFPGKPFTITVILVYVSTTDIEEGQRNSSGKNEEAGPKQKQCSIVNVPGGEGKV